MRPIPILLFPFLALGLACTRPVSLTTATQRAAKGVPRGCIVVGQWKDGKASYAIAGKDIPDSVAPEHLVFEIGSITKTFTGLLLAQAVLEQKLAFDTSLKEALGPEQAFADARVAAITLRQLATHTSGLPRMPNNANFVIADPYATYDAGLLSQWLAQVTLAKDGPHDHRYSNVGVAILGRALERALGAPWEALVRERICLPLGLRDTLSRPDEAQRRRLAPPFAGNAPGHAWTFLAFAPAGSLRSTAADMLRFGQALIEPERTPLKESIQLALKPLTGAGNMGSCFFLGQDRISHGGRTGSYQCELEARPQGRSVCILLINNAEADPVILGKARSALEGERFKAKAEQSIGEAALKGYAGVFSAPETGLTFLVREGRLWGKGTGQPFLPLRYEGGDSFVNAELGIRVVFRPDAQQAAASAQVSIGGQSLVAKRVSQEAPAYRFPPVKDLEEYTGLYALDSEGRKVYTLELRRDTLYAQYPGQSFLPVFQTEKDRFEYDGVKAALVFERDTAGRIQRLHLHQDGRITPFQKRPAR